jgi:hypothetical protein
VILSALYYLDFLAVNERQGMKGRGKTGSVHNTVGIRNTFCQPALYTSKVVARFRGETISRSERRVFMSVSPESWASSSASLVKEHSWRDDNENGASEDVA